MSEALFYANALEVSDKNPALINVNNRAAAELRRLHALNAELLKALKENTEAFEKLMDEGINCTLAVSLHTPDDELRIYLKTKLTKKITQHRWTSLSTRTLRDHRYIDTVSFTLVAIRHTIHTTHWRINTFTQTPHRQLTHAIYTNLAVAPIS